MQTIGENEIRLLLGGVFHHPISKVFFICLAFLSEKNVCEVSSF